MNRKEYIAELVQKLASMPEDERMSAISYYQEYFDEAGVENEQEVINHLGTPSQVARQILADFAVKESVSKPESPKKGIWAIVLMVLAIFALPIAFPLALTAVILAFVAVLLVVIFIFVGFVLVVSFGISGIAVFAVAFPVFTMSPVTGAFCLGIGLVLIGGALLCAALVYLGTAKGIPVIVGGINNLFNRMKRKGNK